MTGTAAEPRVVETFRLGHAVARILEREAEGLRRFTAELAIDGAGVDAEYQEDELEDMSNAANAALLVIGYLAGRQNLPELTRRLREHRLEAV